jgi:hypothetical protein
VFALEVVYCALCLVLCHPAPIWRAAQQTSVIVTGAVKRAPLMSARM